MNPEEFTCTRCGETFNKGQSDDEAMIEARNNFGQKLEKRDMNILCDDCYKEFMSWLAANSASN